MQRVGDGRRHSSGIIGRLHPIARGEPLAHLFALPDGRDALSIDRAHEIIPPSPIAPSSSPSCERFGSALMIYVSWVSPLHDGCGVPLLARCPAIGAAHFSKHSYEMFSSAG